MRRILVENARRKQADKHGGERQRGRSGRRDARVADARADDLLALDEALDELAAERPAQGRAGQAPLLRRPDRRRGGRSALGISAAHRRPHWAYARAWLLARLRLDRTETISEHCREVLSKSGVADSRTVRWKDRIGGATHGDLIARTSRHLLSPRCELTSPTRARGVPRRGLRRRLPSCAPRSRRCCGPTPRPASFLERPVPEPAATLDEPARRRRPARSSAPTSCSQQIGEGGMGMVYMAEQTEPVSRKVALKIIKPGMDTQQVIARFEAERQALALMDHPNIARVLDAGHDRLAAGRTSSWSWSRASRSPSTATSNQLTPRAAAGAVHPGLPGGPARPSEGHHPPRHQAVERAGHAVRRQAGAQGDRLRRRQGDRAAADRADAVHRLRRR